MSCVTWYVFSVMCQMYHVMCTKNFSYFFIFIILKNMMTLVGKQFFISWAYFDYFIINHATFVIIYSLHLNKKSPLIIDPQQAIFSIVYNNVIYDFLIKIQFIFFLLKIIVVNNFMTLSFTVGGEFVFFKIWRERVNN